MTAELPADVEFVRVTDVFDHVTRPVGLLRSHRLADDVWARLVVHDGELVFVFEDDADARVRLGAGDSIVIPPARPHHVELPSPVRFALEFHRRRTATPPESGRESTGLTDT